MTPGSRLRRSLEVDAPARVPHQPQRRAGRGRPGLPGESRPTTKRIPPGDDTESLPGCMGSVSDTRASSRVGVLLANLAVAHLGCARTCNQFTGDLEPPRRS